MGIGVRWLEYGYWESVYMEIRWWDWCFFRSSASPAPSSLCCTRCVFAVAALRCPGSIRLSSKAHVCDRAHWVSSCVCLRSTHRAWHMRSCNLSRLESTLGLDGLNLLEQSLVLTVDLDVTHFLKSNLLGPLVEELEPLGTLLAYTTLETVELGFVDLPGTFDFFVET